MSQDNNDRTQLSELEEVFRQLGARDPSASARSQLEEGIPQLAIFCFIKALWEGVIDDNDLTYIDKEIRWAEQYPTEPCASVGPALREMLTKNVSRRAIIDLIRVKQFEVLYHVCSIIDGSRIVNLPVNKWALYEVDDSRCPVQLLQGLHEVLLDSDPTKREMRMD